MVRLSDLQLDGREFDSWPTHHRVVSTGMGDRLRAGIPPKYVTSHPGQLSLLTLYGTGYEYWKKCGWGVKAGWLIPFVGKRVGVM